MKPVLMLNSDLSPVKYPIQKMTFEQAINRIFSENCYVVISYDKKIKTAKPDALDKYNLRYWPSVIARKSYLNRRNTVSCTKNSIYIRDCGKCQYCGIHVNTNDKTMEHYIPQSKGGTFIWENILLACRECNTRKGDSLPIGKWKPLKMPYEPDFWELVNKELNMPLTIPDSRWMTFLPLWKGPVKIEYPFS